MLALLGVSCRNPASRRWIELELATSATSDETGVNLDRSELLLDDEETPGRHNDLLPAAVGCARTDNIGLRSATAQAALWLSARRP